jgi:hypothetical protein
MKHGLHEWNITHATYETSLVQYMNITYVTHETSPR